MEMSGSAATPDSIAKIDRKEDSTKAVAEKMELTGGGTKLDCREAVNVNSKTAPLPSMAESAAV